jgi:hypothetical protein
MATDTMFEFMGVRVDPLDEAPGGSLRKLTAALELAGRVDKGGGYVFDGRLNESFRAANLLLDKGIEVRRIDKAGQGFRQGDFAVVTASEAALAPVAKETGVDFVALRSEIPLPAHAVKRMRTGMYQRYRGGNIDEGWTRLLLEQFRFPYTTLMDAEIKKGGLNAKYDLIILPEDSIAAITGERPAAAGRSDRPARTDEGIPPEYRSGIGEDGVKALKAFVEKGGTLVTLGGASNFAIEKLELAVRNVTANRSSKEFWCPGSTLRVKIDHTHPLAYGMPSEGLAVYMNGNPAFEITPGEHNERYEVVVRYADRDLLESGWLLGEGTLAKKAAMVSAKHGDGQVILIGFRAQHRAQTYGTFKLLFNALVR